MAPQPKRKPSGRRGRIRGRTLKAFLPTLVACASCGKKTRPHSICSFCGFYKGRLVLPKKEKKVKHEEK